MDMNIYQEVKDAQERIQNYVRTTRLEPAPSLSKISTSEVYLKLENLQHSGSFKVRGAFNKLLSLSDEERLNGVVTASSGNHALAVAFALKELGIPGTIFLPGNVADVKHTKLKEYDVNIEFLQDDSARDDSVQVEAAARNYGIENNRVYISPYNDAKVIGGQGTIGLELYQQEASLDCVFVAVGGGGLISGIAGFLKEARPNIMIVGCEPKNSRVMSESVRAGRIVDVEVSETLSDGTAGGIEPETITLEPCKRLVDEWVNVSETEIAEGIRWIHEHHGLVVEGAAGVVVASYLKRAKELHCSRVGLVICGANINEQKFKELII